MQQASNKKQTTVGEDKEDFTTTEPVEFSGELGCFEIVCFALINSLIVLIIWPFFKKKKSLELYFNIFVRILTFLIAALIVIYIISKIFHWIGSWFHKK